MRTTGEPNFNAVRHARSAHCIARVRVWIVSALIGLGSVMAIGGCTTTTERLPSATAQGRTTVEQHPTAVAVTPFPRAVPRRTGRVAAIMPFDPVPYNNFTIPLVRPDGSMIATQIGDRPSWSTLLAEPAATVTRENLISLYALDWETGAVIHQRTLEQPLLLGRGHDEHGFLVEAPQPTGARWIGFVSWTTGTVNWLIADYFTNAFAAMGPERQMAWSRRDTDQQHFDLMIKSADGERMIEADGGDWLFPTWSATGDAVYVLRLKLGVLQIVHVPLQGTGDVAAANNRPSLLSIDLEWATRLPLMSQATRRDAYQTLATFSPWFDDDDAVDRLVFFNPRHLRVSVWRPGSVNVMLRERSTATVLLDAEGLAVVSTGLGLFIQRVGDLSDQRRVMTGIQLPRRLSLDRWPLMVLSPLDGVVIPTALALVELDELD